MTSQEPLVFQATLAGERLDKQITQFMSDILSRAQVQRLIESGHVKVNGATAKPGMKLKGGEQIEVVVPPPSVDPTVEPEPIPLTVLYEDEDIAVIDKPAGLVVHPGAAHQAGTLVNAILSRYPEVAEMQIAPKRRGIVHRLDKDTSGVLLIARRTQAMHRLMEQFQRRTVEKIYLALVERAPKTTTGRIDAPIDRDPADRKRMKVQRGGRTAISEFEVIQRFREGQALVRVKLLTGRTHQIRVHMAFIGAPIVGDTVYGFRRQRLLRGQFLHAARLCFNHPTTEERLCFETPLPARLQQVLDALTPLE